MTTGFILIRRVALEFDSYYWLSFEALKQCVCSGSALWDGNLFFIPNVKGECEWACRLGWVSVIPSLRSEMCTHEMLNQWCKQPKDPPAPLLCVSQELQAGDGEWHSFSLHHQKLNFMIYAVGGGAGCQGRKWRGGEGRMMGFFDLGGHCIMLGTKKITAVSQWSFHITKHMLVRAFFFHLLTFFH